MKKTLSLIQTSAVIFALVANVFAQQPAQQPGQQPAKQPDNQQAPIQQAPQIDRKKVPLAQRPNLSLEDVSTYIGVDKRIIVMMAALNIAGYDFETGGRQLTPLRQQMREDLKNTPPDVVRRLRDYFLAHRNATNDAAAVAPYLSLALSLQQPPAFAIDVPPDRLPDDVKEISSFALILEEFYQKTSFSRLLPKYIEAYLKAAESYPQAAGLALGNVLNYLHTEPVLELPPLLNLRNSAAAPVKADKPEKKDDKKLNKNGKASPAPQIVPTFESPNRIRQFVIMPDLLNASNAANLRVVRDNYYLLLGPSSTPSIEAMRRSFVGFVLDPLIERQIKEVAAIRANLRKLMESRGDRLDKEYAERSAYFLITDSLVQATDARMDVLGYAARKNSPEDEALYQLSLGYERGAVLVYHFYDQMKAFEPVGVNIRDYVSSMLKNIDFEREAGRLKELEQRLARYKQSRTEATLAPAPALTLANADEKLVARIVEADNLIKNRKYDDAKAILDAALKEKPDNARVLFGLAEVSSKQASTLDDSDRVEEALYAAVDMYKRAAQYASPESEKWLSQRSYVAAAKILDFIAETTPSLSEKLTGEATIAYELAIKLGRIEGGAYDEAEKALKLRAQKK
ncbi:MAG: tetratricopeptide repeat protein [Blastocatellia bacterium]